MKVIRKATARAAGATPLTFVMSDATVDRMGDVIEPSGWVLDNFTRNPVALFGHDASTPIGEWENLRIEAGKLIGDLKFGPLGACPVTDKMRAFVEAGMMRAVSVGFQPLDAEPLPSGGQRYTKSELVECSLVSIPANPNALAVARSLNLSDDVKSLIFGEPAEEITGLVRRGAPGEPALNPILSRKTTMNLSDRIVNAQNDLVQLRSNLSTTLDNGGEIDTISAEIEQKDAVLASLKRAEKALGENPQPGTSIAVIPAPSEPRTIEHRGADLRRPFATVAKKVEPGDYILRAATIKLLAHVHKDVSVDAIRQRAYGDDEATKAVFDHVTRAASAPATTTTSGWASQLVQTANADFMSTLLPASVYPSLAARGLRLTFGRNGAIAIPSRSATPTIAGSFVAEGAPIPVRQGAFQSLTLTPKKMAVISTFTREIAEHSIPAIEGLIRDAIQEDTSVAIDTVLLDAGAATAVRPAGLRNGVTGLTPTAGGGITALVADAKALVGALITATMGNVRAPVWIMNPAQALSISLTGNAGGDFVFADAMNVGNFLGYPVIQSPTVPAGQLMLIDAADFVSVTGDEPLFAISDQATLHMDDSAPLAISTAGTPNVVAAPVRSLFQTDSLGLRMILPMNFGLRRTGVVAWVNGVTW